MSTDPVAVLEAIVAEVAGPGRPFSADSYLPPHLIHDARKAIEAEHKDAAEWKAREAHETILLARLAKADGVIADLRKSNSDLAKAAIAGIEITDKEKSAILGKYGSTPEETDVPDGRFVVLMKRLAKADETIASLRAEIDALRRTGINLALPPGQIIGHGSFESRTLKYDQQACAKLAQEMERLVNVKYDPDSCAESVRDMKECDA